MKIAGRIIVFVTILLLFTFLCLPYLFLTAQINIPRLPNFSSPKNFNANYKDIEIETSDHIKLEGWYIPSEKNKGTIIVCHGVGANKSDVLEVAKDFNTGGYEIYMFDFRGHGDSGDSIITYGYNEKKDISAIINYIKSKGIKKIGMFGLSMGAAITMLSAVDHPEVKAIVADSGFASVEKIVKYRVGKVFPEPFLTILTDMTGFYATNFYKIPFKEIAPINIIDKLNKPVLFIIGTVDTTIPPENGKLLYDKALEPKELFIVEGANHTQTIKDPEYRNVIIKFMDKYLATKSN